MNTINSYRDDKIYFHHSIDKKPNDNDYPMHAHDVYELFCFISGKGRYIIEGMEYSLEPGCMLIMRPSEAHKLYLDGSAPYERAVIEFSDSVIKPVDPDCELLKIYNDRALGHGNKYTHKDLLHSASGYISDMCASGIPDKGARINIITNLLAILNQLSLSRSLKTGGVLSSGSADVARGLIEYINANLFEELSLKRLSEKFFFSQSHLGRIFKAATGSSIADYILTKRLLEAHRLINEGCPATKAAVKCGFADYSAFYRAYKKRFLSSPTNKQRHADNQ